MLTLEQFPLTEEVGEDGRRRIGARRPAGDGEGTALRRRMRLPLVDSVGAEMQHGEAELGAVLASSGVAGVHGMVRRPVAGKMAAEKLGFRGDQRGRGVGSVVWGVLLVHQWSEGGRQRGVRGGRHGGHGRAPVPVRHSEGEEGADRGGPLSGF